MHVDERKIEKAPKKRKEKKRVVAVFLRSQSLITSEDSHSQIPSTNDEINRSSVRKYTHTYGQYKI